MAWKAKNLLSIYSYCSGGQLEFSWLGRVLLGISDLGWANCLSCCRTVSKLGWLYCMYFSFLDQWFVSLMACVMPVAESQERACIAVQAYSKPLLESHLCTSYYPKQISELSSKIRGGKMFHFFCVDLPNLWQRLRIGGNNSIKGGISQIHEKIIKWIRNG